MVNRKILIILGIFFATVLLVAIAFGIIRSLRPEINEQTRQDQTSTQETSNHADLSGYESTLSLLARERATVEETIHHQLEHTGLIEEGDKVSGTIRLVQGSNSSAIQTYLISTEQKEFRVIFDRNQSEGYRIQIECQDVDGNYGGYNCVQH